MTCQQAWPGGLSDFMWNEIGGVELVECVLPENHRGKHGNAEKDLNWWGGKLSDEEMERADLLRARGLTRSSVKALEALL